MCLDDKRRVFSRRMLAARPLASLCNPRVVVPRQPLRHEQERQQSESVYHSNMVFSGKNRGATNQWEASMVQIPRRAQARYVVSRTVTRYRKGQLPLARYPATEWSFAGTSTRPGRCDSRCLFPWDYRKYVLGVCLVLANQKRPQEFRNVFGPPPLLVEQPETVIVPRNELASLFAAKRQLCDSGVTRPPKHNFLSSGVVRAGLETDVDMLLADKTPRVELPFVIARFKVTRQYKVGPRRKRHAY